MTEITDEMRREWDRLQREINQRDAERKAWVPTWDAETYVYGVTATWVEDGRRWSATYQMSVARQMAKHEADYVRDRLRRGIEYQIRMERPTPITTDALELWCFLVDDRKAEHVRIPVA